MSNFEWLVLNFSLPKEPSRVRVSVWRKLKKQGSVNIGQSIWVLPISDENVIFFNEISDEIFHGNGVAYLLQSSFVHTKSWIDIVDLFNQARDVEYHEFFEKCDDFFKEIEMETERKNFSFAEFEENEVELQKLEGWLNKIVARDFFNGSLKKQSEEKLEQCRQILNDFGETVYGINNQIE